MLNPKQTPFLCERESYALLKCKKQWPVAENKQFMQTLQKTMKNGHYKQARAIKKKQKTPFENTINKRLVMWYLEQCLVQPLPQCKAYASNALLRAKCYHTFFFQFSIFFNFSIKIFFLPIIKLSKFSNE